MIKRKGIYVAQVENGTDGVVFGLTDLIGQEGEPAHLQSHSSTAKALQWIRNHGKVGVRYQVLRVTSEAVELRKVENTRLLPAR